MKVYIINFHHVLNYGAVFQGYALCQFLIENGYDAKIIDYRPSYFLSRTYRPAKGLMKTAKKVGMNLNFYKFRKNHFKLTEKILYSQKDLVKFFENSEDAFICGSDQVWNAKITNGRIDPGYFLDFVPKTARKIAYAASIGHTKFNREHKNDISNKLQTFSSISVREDFAKQEVSEISNNLVNPTLVLDPTLILDDYSDVLDLELVPKEDYLVVYTTEDSNDFRKYIQILSDILKIKVINLGHYDAGKEAENYTNIHPSKWLGLFSKATYVCTNSFHGTAFSIIFQRNFTVLGRETMKDLNRRQLTLMSNLGIEDRFIHSINDFNKDLHLKEIDYNKNEGKRKELVADSKKFLLDALN
ncbi:polysaccharide pyruvyl transferase family protein [Cellulophaga sp. Ld12]|uniref:polysaccharide pyruvyl transferase family protein n=1 Tax=Cellulophaga sp. Ld12 TaxID=3229535 RepID=UPI003864C153